jgi:GTPase SAR1 family protein
VFSLTDRISFENVEYWMEQVKENCSRECVLVILGNKSDIYDR